MHVYSYTHSFIHLFIFFFSVDMAHPDLLNKDRLWEFNEKKHYYPNMSFDISRSLVEGNKNQLGWHAWSKVITSLFSAIMGSVNQSFSYYNLKEKLHHMIKDLQKSTAPEATLQLMKAAGKYNHIMAKLAKLGAKIIKSGNLNYPKFINTEVLNNTYRIHCKYMSSDITRQELGRIQEDAHLLLDPILGRDFPHLELAVCRHNASMFLWTIQIYSTS